MVRLSKKTRDRSVSPRRPKALLPKQEAAAPAQGKKKMAFKEHENALSGEQMMFVPRVK